MTKTNYEELMKRYVTGEVTEEERLRIEAWLDMLVDKNTKDLRLTPQEQEELYQKIISKEENIHAIRSFRPGSLTRKIQSTWTMRIAAGIVILLTIGLMLYRVSTNVDIEKITLSDGTRVWVHGKSKLSFIERDGARYAELEGEALFEVAKDASRPFILHYKDVSMRVVGTSFNVKTGERVELKVLTGKVTVTTSHDPGGVVVERNEQLTYDVNEGLTKSELKAEEASQLAVHTEYDMRFDNVEFSKVIEKMQKKFDVTIRADNPAVLDCHVNVDITDNSLEDSLKKLTAILNVEYKINGSMITLTGTGCN